MQYNTCRDLDDERGTLRLRLKKPFEENRTTLPLLGCLGRLSHSRSHTLKHMAERPLDLSQALLPCSGPDCPLKDPVTQAPGCLRYRNAQVQLRGCTRANLQAPCDICEDTLLDHLDVLKLRVRLKSLLGYLVLTL